MFRQDSQLKSRRNRGWQLSLLRSYFVYNLRSTTGYRSSFAIQVAAMALNNCAFIVFWLMLYSNVGVIKGYAFVDVMFLWALSAVGYGVAGVFFGNSTFISRIVYNGELDVYLLQPKPVLGNLVMSRMSSSAWGDLLFGITLFIFSQELSFLHIVLFFSFSVLMAIVLVALRILYHSLAFFWRNVEDFASIASELPVFFSTYPSAIFKGPAMVILNTLVPAALMTYIPAALFRNFDPKRMLLLLSADFCVVAISIAVFRIGLSTYGSGNRIGTRL